jgi:hypothetical protein
MNEPRNFPLAAVSATPNTQAQVLKEAYSLLHVFGKDEGLAPRWSSLAESHSGDDGVMLLEDCCIGG